MLDKVMPSARAAVAEVTGPVSFRIDMALTGAAVSWATMVLGLARDLDRPDGLASHPLAAASWTDVLLTGLLLTQPHSYSTNINDAPGRYRRRSVTRAIDYIDTHLDHPLTLSDIAIAAGVSVRSLQRDFHDCVGMPPMSYLQRCRMTRVHEELQGARPGAGVTVTETALRWGFNHLPRFAESYRRHYGVSPSVTLRRATGT